MNQYWITQNIRYRLLTDFKKNYRKLQYKENVFEEFPGLSYFPRKMSFYSSCNLSILKRWTNIPWPRRFDSGFWQTLKQIYRKLEYKRKVFGKFQGLPCFSREITLPHFPIKMVMNLLRTFVILKHCTIMQLFRRFDLRVWKNLKQI